MRTYLVYTYQYNDMKQPKRAVRWYREPSDIDTLPPTVIDLRIIKATSRRQAMKNTERGIN